MKSGKYCLLIILTCIGFTTADAQENLAQEAYAIFEQSCLNCHGESGAYKDELLIERTALVDTGVVIPGDPEGSEFYKRLLGPTENGAQMPLNLPPLSQEAIETIAHWITIGASDWDVQYDINFITTAAMLDTMRTHLESLDPFDRPSARYFTMTHLHNAGESPETLNDYRIALSKLINSLSWRFEITNPTPIDEAQTIFHIDLRRYEWNTRTDVWPHIEQAYPYTIAFDPETQAGLLEKLTQLQTETGSTVPFVHVDWFLATASLPPLYHDILGLPETDRMLETQLEVDVASNIRHAPGINVWRAGFNDSGVSTNNRVVERHTSRYGAYWKSYDFAGNLESQHIFTHPLDFTHDGGEIIFNLPNGLQAYFLVDANGNRLDAAPIDIVSNPAASDPTVRNGLSCIGCHTQGMKKFKDSVRAAIEQDENPPYNKEQALRLYPEQSKLDELLEKDTQRFQQALEKIGGPFADDASRQQFFKRHENEPVQRFHEAFQAPLDASHAAAAVGLKTEAFLTQIREKQSLKNLGLQTLIDVNGTVKRDAWTSNFHDMISALNTPDSTLPPVVERRPERIPGETVDISDSNLRAAIAAELDKAAGDTITTAEMATLERLDANNMDISDLTGLEFAINLRWLAFSDNTVSDLSPIAGLTNLTFLWFEGTRQVADLSPLTGLINLEKLHFSSNSVSDLSPIKGLTNLTALEFNWTSVSDLSILVELVNLEWFRMWGHQVSDLSPLAGLTKLEWIGICGGQISDLTPLAGLTNLKSLRIANEQLLSDISPLADLTGLEHLHLRQNNISDLAPLTGLTNLNRMELDENNISDLTPLAGLTNLRQLHLHKNEILDLSPLARLTNLEELNLQDNLISDISPLVELINLRELDLSDNPISDFSSLDELFKNSEVRIFTTKVNFTDPNLRAAIEAELGKSSGDTITAVEMATFERLNADNKDISDLTGLEFAINLEILHIQNNPISDLSPLAELIKLKELQFVSDTVSDLSPLVRLKNLEKLAAWHAVISDLSPLKELTKLRWLACSHAPLSDLSPLSSLSSLRNLVIYVCDISDISPLKGLTELTHIQLSHNRISDISPLAGLTNLESLSIKDNQISNISSLSGLSNLRELRIGENKISDVSPLASLHNLTFLEIEYNNISDFSSLDGLDQSVSIVWHANPGFPKGGPKIEGPWLWITVPGEGEHHRELSRNRDLLSDASDGVVTEQQIATDGATIGSTVGNSVWTAGEINASDDHNITHMLHELGIELPESPNYVLYGSITLYSPHQQNTTMYVGGDDDEKVWLNGELIYHSPHRYLHSDYETFFPVTLKQGRNVLLVATYNDGGAWSAFFGFEEGTEYILGGGFSFSKTTTNVIPGDTFTLNLNAENITDLAGWQADITFDPEVLEAVEVTEGDFLKAEGGDTFFQEGTIDNTAGKITDLFSARISESGISGTGALLSVTFKAKAGGKTQVTLENFEFSSISGAVIPSVPPDITIIVGQYPAWDVNQDGRVSVVDLVLVAKDLGSDAPANLRTDVNRDGIINIQDLIIVSQHLGESTDAAAPSVIAAINNGELTPAVVQAWITQAQTADNGSFAFRQGIANLERLLALFIPEETALLHNYPNPFNPETWIPYQLAKPAEVTLTIYATNGAIVRTLVLGHQPAGIYQYRSRAAYWDGKNEVGEPVASGVYFYTLTAGDFNATRKMLIKK